MWDSRPKRLGANQAFLGFFGGCEPDWMIGAVAAHAAVLYVDSKVPAVVTLVWRQSPLLHRGCRIEGEYQWHQGSWSIVVDDNLLTEAVSDRRRQLVTLPNLRPRCWQAASTTE
jgi:hypothetical protein